MKKLIVFVCNGNIHRSVVAEKFLTKILKGEKLDNKFSVASYGLQGIKGAAKPLHKNLKGYLNEWNAALPTLREFKIAHALARHNSRSIAPTVAEKATIIIAMDKKTYSGKKNSLVNQFPDEKNKIHLFSELTKNHKDIKDPFGSEDLNLHQDIIENIYSTIKKNLKTILDWTNTANKNK